VPGLPSHHTVQYVDSGIQGLKILEFSGLCGECDKFGRWDHVAVENCVARVTQPLQRSSRPGSSSVANLCPSALAWAAFRFVPSRFQSAARCLQIASTCSLPPSPWPRALLPQADFRQLALGQHLDFRSDLGNCDPAVTRRLPSKWEMIGFVFRNWSGARDLNPGPHGPESHDSSSKPVGFCVFPFDSSNRHGPSVQICTNLQPDYYMKYYRMQVVQTVTSNSPYSAIRHSTERVIKPVGRACRVRESRFAAALIRS
jgi:hypothetical protein